MPGIYAADRDSASGRAGLALPFTPTKGPLRFVHSVTGYKDVPMYDHYLGPAASIVGLQTHLISECSVFCAAEWTSTGWGAVYFTHVHGGDWTGGRQLGSLKALKTFASAVRLADCYTVILVPGEMGYGPFAQLPGDLKFPASQLSVYISNTSGGLGFAVEFRVMGEFGELDAPRAKTSPSTPFGLRDAKGASSQTTGSEPDAGP
jgi:hypothetical protein